MISSFNDTPLSNFYPSPFETPGHLWQTVEHYFQAMKCVDPLKMRVIEYSSTPEIAKRNGRIVELRSDWKSVKDSVMRHGLYLKFAGIDKMRAYLLGTGDEELVEGNTWHDNYWGRCSCPAHEGLGQNVLGAMLMELRASLR